MRTHKRETNKKAELPRTTVSIALGSSTSVIWPPVSGFAFDYAYDPIGNRTSATEYDESGAPLFEAYAANELNQNTRRSVPGYAAVRGEADTNAVVMVNKRPMVRVGAYCQGGNTGTGFSRSPCFWSGPLCALPARRDADIIPAMPSDIQVDMVGKHSCRTRKSPVGLRHRHLCPAPPALPSILGLSPSITDRRKKNEMTCHPFSTAISVLLYCIAGCTMRTAMADSTAPLKAASYGLFCEEGLIRDSEGYIELVPTCTTVTNKQTIARWADELSSAETIQDYPAVGCLAQFILVDKNKEPVALVGLLCWRCTVVIRPCQRHDGIYLVEAAPVTRPRIVRSEAFSRDVYAFMQEHMSERLDMVRHLYAEAGQDLEGLLFMGIGGRSDGEMETGHKANGCCDENE